MKAARYLFRLDDITPGMKWQPFLETFKVLERHGVKPLFGIVPDNKDPTLEFESPNGLFWRTMQRLQRDDRIEIAQHGYQHILTAKRGRPILGSQYGFKERSEFTGLSLEEQYEKISKGKSVLRAHGIESSYWMSPSHSFDETTLKALKQCGFNAVTDGIALFPYCQNDLIFVPQQYARGVWLPFGVITVCLHTNNFTRARIKELDAFLSRKPRLSTFSEEVARCSPTDVAAKINCAFNLLYRIDWQCKKAGSAVRVKFDISESHKNPAPWGADFRLENSRTMEALTDQALQK